MKKYLRHKIIFKFHDYQSWEFIPLKPTYRKIVIFCSQSVWIKWIHYDLCFSFHLWWIFIMNSWISRRQNQLDHHHWSLTKKIKKLIYLILFFLLVQTRDAELCWITVTIFIKVLLWNNFCAKSIISFRSWVFSKT